MKAATLPPCKGFDTIAPISAKKAAEFYAADWRFRIGYVHEGLYMPVSPCAGPRGIYYLSRDCVAWTLDAGLAVGAVQQFGGSKKLLGYDQGYRRGLCAAANLMGIGVREPIHLWYDLEHAPVSDDLVLSDIAGWTDAVQRESPFRRGLYVGYWDLSGAKLWSIPGVDSYWRAGMGKLPTPSYRGYAMYQHRQATECGVMVDKDDLTPDQLGQSPLFLVP